MIPYNILVNPIRPEGGGGGSEARMTRLTAANQKPLILLTPKLGDFKFLSLRQVRSDQILAKLINQLINCSVLIETPQKF